MTKYHCEKCVSTRDPITFQLGIIPKNIFEESRVRDICSALYYHTHCKQEANTVFEYEQMIKCAEELTDRLQNLKFDKEIGEA